jgi:chorismate dehydratase
LACSLRIGAVGYLNAQPLIYGLDNHGPWLDLRLDHPSCLADALARDELDVALIPSVEYLRGSVRGYRIVPGLSIAARGPVRSVKLFCRVPPERVQRLALDEGSRTSQVLTRVWLAEEHGVQPRVLELLPVGVSPLESTADAILVIGDRAMCVPTECFACVIDLGEAWVARTGLPFVFALWVARRGVDLGPLAEVLHDCRARGLEHAPQIAADYAPRLGLSVSTCLEYLTRVLSYELGASEIAGLRLFAAKAAALGLAPEGVDLVFLDRLHDLAARR